MENDTIYDVIKTGFLILLLVIGTLFLTSYPLSDQGYFTQAKELPAVRSFLQKYPESQGWVEKGIFLSVNYEQLSVDQNKNAFVRLRVPFDSIFKRPMNPTIECWVKDQNTKTDQNVEKFLQNDGCFEK